MRFDYPIIDIHTHLRNNIEGHTEIAKASGIDAVVYMANCHPPLDNLERIKESLKAKRSCVAVPVSAITKNLEGKELVNVEEIKHFVAGFSDDGNYLENLDLLREILERGVLVMAHCNPPYELGIDNPLLETRFIEQYISVIEKSGGKLHIQHISKKESVDLIRRAKRQGINITCETCPHYFSFTKQDLEVKVNPPLATEEDIFAIKQGLADGTIDVIASDYAPKPRKTGISGFKSFLPLSYSLVLEGIISEKQLKEKLFINPQKIIGSGGFKLNLKN